MTEKAGIDSGKIIDFDLALDVKEFLSLNPDVEITKELKDKVNCADDYDMLKVTKEINSPIKVVEIEVVTLEILEEKLG